MCRRVVLLDESLDFGMGGTCHKTATDDGDSLAVEGCKAWRLLDHRNGRVPDRRDNGKTIASRGGCSRLGLTIFVAHDARTLRYACVVRYYGEE